MSSSQLVLTIFKTKTHTQGVREDLSWNDLFKKLEDPEQYPSKADLPLIHFAAMPGNSRARSRRPISISAVVGDYDDGQVSPEVAAEKLRDAGIAAFIYTTASHSVKAPRWRVVAQLSSPVSEDQYKTLMDGLNCVLGEILARESWDTKRPYFWGKVTGVEYAVLRTDGRPLDHVIEQGALVVPARDSWNAKTKTTLPKNPRKIEEVRDFDRAVTIGHASDQTLHELKFALEAIKDRADERGQWNETFLAMLSLKGTPYEVAARHMIEEWSQKHSGKWGEKEDDDSKWDRENSNDITYASIFHWADEVDRKNGLNGTTGSWRSRAAQTRPDWQSLASDGNIVSYGDFCGELKAPHYVWHRVLQLGCLYALTAQWGHGKTALMVTVALHVAVGRTLGGHPIEMQKVLYLCGENPEDVKLRALATATHYGFEHEQIERQIFFTKRPFNVDDQQALMRFLDEAASLAPFGFMVIDTGPAHSVAEDENDNREMHKLAMAMRELMVPLGNPATVALMHPTKEAKRDNLQPRGGGAFSGSIDGELCAWQEDRKIELFHRTKLRGPGFKPIWFKLQRYEFPGLFDNFDEPVSTVLAVESEIQQNEFRPKLKPMNTAQKIACKALELALSDLKIAEHPSEEFSSAASSALECSPPVVMVSVDEWKKRAFDMGIADGTQDAKRKAFSRAYTALVQSGRVKCWQDQCWL